MLAALSTIEGVYDCCGGQAEQKWCEGSPYWTPAAESDERTLTSLHCLNPLLSFRLLIICVMIVVIAAARIKQASKQRGSCNDYVDLSVFIAVRDCCFRCCLLILPFLLVLETVLLQLLLRLLLPPA